MNTAAYIMGLFVMIGAGLLVAAAFLAACAVAVGFVGAWLYKRLARAYHLNVIWYWINRLEEEGTHCFQKAGADSATERKS